MIDYNCYRENYASFDRVTLEKWHDMLYVESPDQNHFNKYAISAFFSHIDPVEVFEVGGWDGELADFILSNKSGIAGWRNAEICVKALDRRLCRKGVYTAIYGKCTEVPHDCDTVVMSHVIEHMLDDEARHIIRSIDAENLYIDTPISGGGSDWNDTSCFHVLKMGWNELFDVVKDCGFTRIGISNSAQWFAR